jgi:mannose-6-phosphate isomerase-like protein (cupin superfamily)
MQKINKYEPLNHYKWGNNCDGWVLVDTEDLSVKQERMSPQTSEALHYHEKAQQFFFILRGIATFEVEEKKFYSSRRGRISYCSNEKASHH